MIRTERERQELSIVDLASMTGLKAQYISDCERGTRNFGLSNLSKLLKALDSPAGQTDIGDVLTKRFAVNIRSLREQQGLSQEGLAASAGVHRTYVSMLERGVRNISVDNVERLANALNADEEHLLGITLDSSSKAAH